MCKEVIYPWVAFFSDFPVGNIAWKRTIVIQGATNSLGSFRYCKGNWVDKAVYGIDVIRQGKLQLAIVYAATIAT